MLTSKARALRRDMTNAEKKLWSVLRDRRMGVKFRRQYPFDCYVLDFVCTEKRLVIEADGGQHADGTDTARDAVLKRYGWRVLRFWNTDILTNLDGVVETIRRVLDE